MASDISERLRAEVARRAGHRCEYCLIDEDDVGFPLQVDHVVSRKHGGSSGFENLAYACAFCNRYKGSDVASVNPETGEAVSLFNPRLNSWKDHFRLDGVWIKALTDVGVANGPPPAL